jgi:hypothetical protein
VSKAGLKVFRRPLRDAEITTYSNVYTAARGQMQDHDGSLKHVLWAMLASAEFLYRIELPKANAKRPLDGYELASRLSYFLWSSAPDDALLTAAASNALSTDEQVGTTVDRMLKDGKSARFIESFAGQWLGARKVSSHPVAAERFPMWSQAVADSAMNEMYLYFQDFLQNPRPWTDFLKADINFVNSALAPIYGMQNVTSANLMQVSNTTDDRKGFMGLVGFLALSSMDRRTSPTLRGKWVLGNMLCTEAPAPPANVPKLETAGKDLESGNIRKILEEHRVNQACASCHAIFDPFGLALEKYDAIGRFRTTYGDGSAIDASTELGGQQFEGLSGAADIVTAKPEFKTCFARKIFTYGLGRAPSNDDKLWIDKMAHEWETGGLTVRGLIDGFTHSEPFRTSGDVQ